MVVLAALGAVVLLTFPHASGGPGRPVAVTSEQPSSPAPPAGSPTSTRPGGTIGNQPPARPASPPARPAQPASTDPGTVPGIGVTMPPAY